jgi:hypothetical protein
MEQMTHESFKKLLKEKIANTNMEMVKADVKPFLKEQGQLEIWSADYFTQLVDMIVFA